MSKTTQAAQLINETVFIVDGMSALTSMEVWDGRKILLKSFYSGTPFNSPVLYEYDSSQAQTGHDGWSTINPGHLSTIGSANWYTSNGDATDDSGTGCWVRDTEGWIDVKEAGAKGDNVTNDTKSFEAIRDADKTILVSEGNFLVNFSLGDTHIIGLDRDSSNLKSYSASGYAITLNVNPNWRRIEIRNLFFSGGSSKNGIQFGSSTYSSSDQFIGRYSIRDCTFYNLDKCIHKRYGNIGNIIDNCSFEDANYHYYAEKDESSGTYIMHSGNDVVTNNHFKNADLASIYIDATENDGGQTIFDGNIIESCAGFAFFIESYKRGSGGSPLEIRNHWNEAIASAGSVTINSVSYTPREFYFKDTELCKIDGIKLGEFELINSNVRILSAGGGSNTGFDVIKDSDSTFKIERWEGYKLNNLDIVVDRMMPSTGGIASPLYGRLPHKKSLSSGYDNSHVFSRIFDDNDQWTFAGGSTPQTATRVDDGALFSSSAEFTTTNGSVNLLHSNLTIPAGFVVVTFCYKKISGVDGLFDITGSVGVMSNIPIEGSDWRTVGFITELGSDATSVSLQTDSVAGTTTLRIESFQIHSFSDRNEAVNFLNSGVFRLPDGYKVDGHSQTGVFTPTFAGSTSGTVTGSEQEFVKRGNEVTIYFEDTKDLSSLSGDIYIEDMPFVAKENAVGTAVIHWANVTYSKAILTPNIQAGDDFIYLKHVGSGGNTNLTDGDIAGNSKYQFTLSYLVEQ